MKKILFTDLDGTLLKDDKMISEANYQALCRMLEAGHYVVVATARRVSSGVRIIKERGLRMPGCFLTASNGAVIYDCWENRVLSERTIPIEYAKYLFEEAHSYGIHAHTYSGHMVLTCTEDKELEYFVRTNDMPYRICEDVVAELEKEPGTVVLASLDNQDALMRFQREHLEWEKDKCSSFFTCKEYLEYCPKDTSKESGIRFLSEYLGVRYEDIYAIGDERNDISMIRAAGVGIAMQNAVLDAKEVADYVTEHDNNHDAVAEVIEKFIL